ncbi:hypothetical protein LXL04_017689 [Taraxacum kok-saghyz]
MAGTSVVPANRGRRNTMVDDEKLVFETSRRVEPIMSFDQMGIKDDLLRGIAGSDFDFQTGLVPISKEVDSDTRSGTGFRFSFTFIFNSPATNRGIKDTGTLQLCHASKKSPKNLQPLMYNSIRRHNEAYTYVSQMLKVSLSSASRQRDLLTEKNVLSKKSGPHWFLLKKQSKPLCFNPYSPQSVLIYDILNKQLISTATSFWFIDFTDWTNHNDEERYGVDLKFFQGYILGVFEDEAFQEQIVPQCGIEKQTLNLNEVDKEAKEFGALELLHSNICQNDCSFLSIMLEKDNKGIPLCPSADDMFSFKLKRKQFPIRLSFAMTINKPQGQTISNVGVYLPKSVFSHGQLYVALSRGISRENTKVLVKAVKELTNEGVYTSNVVYRESRKTSFMILELSNKNQSAESNDSIISTLKNTQEHMKITQEHSRIYAEYMKITQEYMKNTQEHEEHSRT